MYDEGERINISLCLSFPGDYLLKTETNGTNGNDDVFSVGDFIIPLTDYNQNKVMFSLDSGGLVYDAPTMSPTWPPPTWNPTTAPTVSIGPTSSQYP
eukprot:scaffold386446_cov136-Cyclotella_meneghiniana.AAC.1